MKTIFYILLVIFVMSCKSSSSAQSNNNPIEDIAWIKEYIQETNKSEFPTRAMITQYTYKGETVYLVDGCYQCPDAMSTLYTAKKEKLCTFGGMVPSLNNTCPDFSEQATNEKVLWKSF